MSLASRFGVVGGIAGCLACGLAFGFVSGGCGGESAGDLLVQAGDAYGEAQYGRAVDCARRAAKTSQGIARDQANYIEGLGEWKLGRLDEGAALFSKVAQSNNRALAADALVSLGSLEIERKQFDAAGRAYTRAAESLEGTERRRAFGVALRCYERAGLSVEADKLRTKAGLPPTDREIAVASGATSGATSARRAATTSDTPEGIESTQKSPATSQTPPTSREVAQRNGLVSKGAPPASDGGNGSATRPLVNAPQYAIQAGAFSDAARARAVSREVAKRAQASAQASADAGENLGAPRVVEKVSAGKTIYVVQIGRFANRTEAAKAMRRFDKLGYTVEPLAE